MLKTFFFILISVGVHLASAASKYDMNCKCGQIGSTSKRGEDYRIVGGQKVKFEQVPWFVYFKLDPGWCGGVLINKFWVLSAAHCFCEKHPCSRVKVGKTLKWKIDYNISDPNRIKAFVGGHELGVAELVPHYKWNLVKTDGKKKTQRKDYDIALVRLDYPAVDISGLTYLPKNKFDHQIVMPICLPTSKDFQDNEKRVFAAGIGVNRPRKQKCFTDGSGPEVFQQCAPQWVDSRNNDTDNYGKYTKIRRGCIETRPPSFSHKVCKKFHEKIDKIRSKDSRYKEHTRRDKKFLKQFNLVQKNGKVKPLNPTESILLPTYYLKKSNDLIRRKKTHCFRIDPGEAGWCATCRADAKKGEPGFCNIQDKDRLTENPEEIAIASTSSGWGFCHKSCNENYTNLHLNEFNEFEINEDGLKKVELKTLSDKLCKAIGFRDEDNLGDQLVVNTRMELCGVVENKIDLTLVKYTEKKKGKKKRFYFSKFNAPKDKKEMFKSARIKYSGNKLKDLAAKKGIIIGGEDTCQGDSGGPVWVEENGKAVLVGLVSRGRGCAYRNLPGIYTRVKMFLRWISYHTKNPEIYQPKKQRGTKQVYKFTIKRKRKKKKTISIRIDNCTKLRFEVYPQCSGNKGDLYRKKRRDKQALKECSKKFLWLLNKKERRDKRKGSRSDYEAKEEVAATIEDKDEEDKEYMEVLKAEEADSELDFEMD